MRREAKRNAYRILHRNKDDDDCSPESSPIGQATTQQPYGFLQEAIFAAGSFCNLEASFGVVDGVMKTATGYHGGTSVKPNYREVCQGFTGHTQAVKVIYDTRKISFKSICKVFWVNHDPTNKLYLDFGAGTHLRSAIFCKNDEQKKQAHESKVERQMKLNRRIVTKILLLEDGGFYLAETIHQKYFLQQRHVYLCENLGLRSTDHFVESHLACKLNGILSNDQSNGQSLKTFLEIYHLPLQIRQILEETLVELEKNKL